MIWRWRRTHENDAPLSGLKVIDQTQALAGPYCSMILGDLGADVIKIERPGVGDQSRQWAPPYIGDQGCYYLAVNRNKRGIALNIRAEAGARDHAQAGRRGRYLP